MATPSLRSIAGLPDEVVTSAQVRVTGRDGRWAGRSGVRDVRTRRPVPADARFRIGSATKMFTASLVLQLVAEGRLCVSTSRCRPCCPARCRRRTPRSRVGQLLDHTSGLPKSTEDVGHEDPAWMVRHRFDWFSPRAVVRSAIRQPMAFAPGTHQQYNGLNYILAGLVVEAVTGHSFAHELRTRLLRPLALDDTYLPGPRRGAPARTAHPRLRPRGRPAGRRHRAERLRVGRGRHGRRRPATWAAS